MHALSLQVYPQRKLIAFVEPGWGFFLFVWFFWMCFSLGKTYNAEGITAALHQTPQHSKTPTDLSEVLTKYKSPLNLQVYSEFPFPLCTKFFFHNLHNPRRHLATFSELYCFFIFICPYSFVCPYPLITNVRKDLNQSTRYSLSFGYCHLFLLF